MPSAGARSGVWPAMAAPVSAICRMNRSGLRSTESPANDSSLSSVPPVKPRPRPESLATATPSAATSGTTISESLSPTPPVLCLSTTGRPTRAEVEHAAGGRHQVGQVGKLLAVQAVAADGHQPGRDLIVGHVAAHVAADQRPPARRGRGARPSACGPEAQGWSVPRTAPPRRRAKTKRPGWPRSHSVSLSNVPSVDRGGAAIAGWVRTGSAEGAGERLGDGTPPGTVAGKVAARHARPDPAERLVDDRVGPGRRTRPGSIRRGRRGRTASRRCPARPRGSR